MTSGHARLQRRRTGEGYAPGRARMTLGEGHAPPHILTVELRESHTLRIRAVDGEGRSVEQVTIELASAKVQSDNTMVFEPNDGEPAASAQIEDWIPRASQTTDAQGYATFKALPDAQIRLSASGKGIQSTALELRSTQGSAELRCTRISAGAAARIAAIDKQLQGLYMEMVQAKETDARREVRKRIERLQREKLELSGGLTSGGPDAGDIEEETVEITEDEIVIDDGGLRVPPVRAADHASSASCTRCAARSPSTEESVTPWPPRPAT